MDATTRIGSVVTEAVLRNHIPRASLSTATRANDSNDTLVHLGSYIQACTNLLFYTADASFKQLLSTLETLFGLLLVEFPRTG